MGVPAQPVFAVRTVDRGDIFVVKPMGELDLATTAELTRALALARRSRAAAIVVDLGRLSFIDSSGVQTLATTRRVLGDRLILANPMPQVRRVFELAGLAGVLGDVREPRRATSAAASRRGRGPVAITIRRRPTRRPRTGSPDRVGSGDVPHVRARGSAGVRWPSS